MKPLRHQIASVTDEFMREDPGQDLGLAKRKAAFRIARTDLPKIGAEMATKLVHITATLHAFGGVSQEEAAAGAELAAAERACAVALDAVAAAETRLQDAVARRAMAADFEADFQHTLARMDAVSDKRAFRRLAKRLRVAERAGEMMRAARAEEDARCREAVARLHAAAAAVTAADACMAALAEGAAV